jgi:hypothetical protein
MLRKALWVSAAMLAAGIAWAAAGEATVLFDFENDADVAAWQVEDVLKDKVKLEASDEHATSGKRSLKMTLQPHEWPGMSTTKLPKDWSGQADLAFDVFSAVDTTMSVRIDDDNSKDYASRFNSQAQDLVKGKNTVTLALADVGDAVDLKKIKALYLFSTDVPEQRVFFIDNIRLIKKK